MGAGQHGKGGRPGGADEDIGRDSSAHLPARHRTILGNVGGAEVNGDCCGPGINLRQVAADSLAQQLPHGGFGIVDSDQW